ncbi:Arm DNA-binding domain-containing protein [Pseudooceanicola sp.]|uniref:Arm DNA-binding domain-containing protein n=1 Tax=Pseudooceanicola sp. TaxID=1914328 RepID=UPI00261243A6|nr:Arm DNA-binding domain-containing protein [Pseudooceanicola sp.]
MSLSDIKIRNLHSTEKAYKVSDLEGLFILVKVSGAKSWRFKYRIYGKARLLVIGDFLQRHWPKPAKLVTEVPLDF